MPHHGCLSAGKSIAKLDESVLHAQGLGGGCGICVSKAKEGAQAFLFLYASQFPMEVDLGC
eukprot:1659340-Lingulodinium_polyedra.AAC.1